MTFWGSTNYEKSYLSQILVLVITSFLFTSCLKTEHTVRVKNSYIEAFTDVSVRGTSYGRIESGSTTSYKPIDEGSFTISGSTVSGQQLSGSGSVTGKGIHKWTLTITTGGGVSLVED